MNNATRENKKNIILNEPSHLKFSTAQISGTQLHGMPPETAPHLISKRRILDEDDLDVQSKEEMIINVATNRDQLNIVSDKSSIFNVNGPGSDQKKQQKVFVQKTADSIFNPLAQPHGQDFSLVEDSDVSSPKSGAF